MSPIVSGKAVKHAALWDAQNGLCFYCEVAMVQQADDRRGREALVTEDHFMPRAFGATRPNNIVLACSGCNHAAAHTMPSEKQVAKFATLYRRAGLDPEPVVKRMGAYWGTRQSAKEKL